MALGVRTIHTVAQEAEVHSTEPLAHLTPLTGLRFIPAILVVLYHQAAMTTGDYGQYFHRSFPNVIAYGYAGVTFFFVLSGFILAYNYRDSGRESGRQRYHFWLTRFARVYPVYLLAFAVATGPFLWEPHSLKDTFLNGFANLTLTQAWLPTIAFSWNGPAWSLSDEAFFYLLFPLVVAYIARLNRRQLYMTMVVLWTTSVACTYVCIQLAAALQMAHPYRAYLIQTALQTHPLIHLPEFLIGIAVGRMFVTRPQQPLNSSTPWFARPALLSILALIGLGWALDHGTLVGFFFMHNGLLDPLVALLVYNLASKQGIVAWFFSLPFIVLLGEASYGLYILHLPLRGWMVHIFAPKLMVPQSPQFLAVFLTAAIVVSLLSFRFIEQPARYAIRQMFRGRASQVYTRQSSWDQIVGNGWRS